MLPIFSQSHKQMIEIRDDKFWEGYYSVSPMLSQIGMRPQREGHQSSFQDEQGKIQEINYKKKTVTIQRKLEYARGMTIEEYIETAKEPGIGIGKETMRSIYEMLEKVTKETGNVVNLGDRPLTYDTFLDLLEKIQFDFTPDGTPRWPSLSLGSDAQAHLQRVWPEWIKDPKFHERLTKIMDNKREEFYEREACRRLVD